MARQCAAGTCLTPTRRHRRDHRARRCPPLAVASRARMEEAWSVFDVYLLTDGPDGDVAIPGLALTFGEAGVALCKRDGEPVWDGAWGSLEELSFVERSLLPDGS